MAPLYDVVSTVLYPSIYLEMGVSFGGDRRIDHVTKDLVLNAANSSGLTGMLASGAISDIALNLPKAMESAAFELEEEGFPDAIVIWKKLSEGINNRIAAITS